MTVPATKEVTAGTVEQVLIKGDLSKLTEGQRLEYYNSVCKSIGLNPLTRPFEYLTLSGRLVLYARKDATDQLRKLNGISIHILSEKYEGGLFTVHAQATDRDGRTDEDYGVVPWNEKMAAEFASNLKMKAITKAKRRVTLSISGLGWLDETEVDDIPEQATATPPTAKTYREPETGPNMTKTEAIAFGSKLIRAIQQAPSKAEKQLAIDMAGDEMRRMHRDQTEAYDRLIKAIDNEMAQFQA